MPFSSSTHACTFLSSPSLISYVACRPVFQSRLSVRRKTVLSPTWAAASRNALSLQSAKHFFGSILCDARHVRIDDARPASCETCPTRARTSGENARV